MASGDDEFSITAQPIFKSAHYLYPRGEKGLFVCMMAAGRAGLKYPNFLNGIREKTDGSREVTTKTRRKQMFIIEYIKEKLEIEFI